MRLMQKLLSKQIIAYSLAISIAFLIMCTADAIAQNSYVVTGRILDASSPAVPVAGASVMIKGTQSGTSSAYDGTFSLNVPDLNVTLVVSFFGFKTIEEPVSGRQVINFTLEENVILIDAVVAVGYGAQKKVNLTGAVASVSVDNLSDKPIVNAIEGLQGTTPGLIIQKGTSSPGGAPSINIRGLNTMNDNNPLVIIDGMEASLANLNPNDIEQISILKDASSTAIYGSRASNGVVLVTTKTGKKGKTEVTYNFNYGLQQPTALPKIVDSWIYAELYNEAAFNSGRSTKFSAEDIANFKSKGPNVRWIEEIYKSYAPQSSHNFSVNGGNEKITYLASLGYLEQNSLFKGPDYGYKRYNARMNLRHQVSSKLVLELYSQFTRNNIREHSYWTEWIIEQANRMPAIYKIKNDDGSYAYPSGSNSNSLQRLEQGGYRQQQNDDISSSLKAEYLVLKGWKLIGNAGIRSQNNVFHENRKAFSGTGDAENKLTEQFYGAKNITVNLMTTYEHTFGRHNINALLGYSYEGFSDKHFSTFRITEDSKYDVFVGELKGDNVGNAGGRSDWSMYSGFVRLNYNYADKYLFEFNIRNDYSSYFAKGNRSGVFPSLSAGWRVSQEPFWHNIKSYLPSLKLRASWGMVGNNRIGAYRYMQTVSVLNGISFGNELAPTVNFASANPDIKWETTRMTDIGLDVGLFRNNLNISFDYFNNRTKNILVNLPVSGIFGNGAPVQNAGEVETSGWEMSASYYLKTGEFDHDISINLSDSKNRVVNTNGEEIIDGYDVNTIIKEGFPLFSYYAYKSDGFFMNQDECNAGPKLSGIIPKPGDIRYLDKNGDGIIKEDDDRFIVGNDFPRYLYGFSYGLRFKGLFFSMFWQGVGKRSRWMRGESVEAFHNNNEGPLLDFHIDRWTPLNTGAAYPRLTMGAESANNAVKSDFWIQDASYIRLKNIKIGYSLPKSFINKAYLQDFTLYCSMENAMTFSKMRGGWDPEYNAAGSGRAYPVARVFSVGLSAKF